MTAGEALTLVAYLNAAYVKDSLTAETVKVWAAAISGYDADVAQRAARDYVRTHKWPNLAEFCAAIEEATVNAAPAERAWATVLDAAAGRTSHDDLHVLVKQAIREIGGMWAIQTADRTHYIRRDFLEQYRSLVDEAHRRVRDGSDWRRLGSATRQIGPA